MVARRLGVWLRLAIVMSVVWMLAGSVYFLVAMNADSEATYAIITKLCDSNQSQIEGVPSQQYANCMDRAQSDLASTVRSNLAHAPLYAALTLLAVWIVGWIITKAVRWVLAGRKDAMT